jgi:hypothetical protein
MLWDEKLTSLILLPSLDELGVIFDVQLFSESSISTPAPLLASRSILSGVVRSPMVA